VAYRKGVTVRVAGILLAAGDGSRLGQPKALVTIAGRTLAERGVALLTEGGTDPVLVVTGAAPIPAATLHTVDNLHTVYNPEWRSGMGSSLAAGLAALNVPATAAGMDTGTHAGTGSVPVTGPGGTPNADTRDEIGAAVIALADQPLVGAEAVRRLISAFGDGAQVAVATYGGQPRNPVLVARHLWPQVIGAAKGDAGARPFLRAHPELVTLVECGDTGSPDDIDTEDDLARLREMIKEA
jgi:CTP:molybdopterin cytidylyltransferase MocA